MLVVITYTHWRAGNTSVFLATGQTLLRTGLLVLFYKDNILPFILKSLS
jgi:hypothetical protein